MMMFETSEFNMQKLVTLFLGSGGTKLLRGTATENSRYSLTSAVPLYETSGVCAFSLFQFQTQGMLHKYTIIFSISCFSLYDRKNTDPNKVMIMTFSSLLIGLLL